MAKSKSEDKPKTEISDSRRHAGMQKVFGFNWSDLASWASFIKLLHRPSDPANLAVLRILYGMLMTFDCVLERGLSYADFEWGSDDDCRFPLLHFLKPLPLAWMYVVYLCMALGAFGIMLGLFYRISCFMFLLPYWYIFLLDKTSWNNHSYLFGLIGFMLSFMDANRYWSVDGLIWPQIRNSHIPLWNYTLIRSQIFLVYFYAGLKKLDLDWMSGYSMGKLSYHWVFTPFTYILSNEQIDLFIVHLGGLTLDMSMGYLLFFDLTRPFAFFFGGSFHVMNSQLFSIGMFPYAMLATMPLFCAQDWPRKIFRCLPLSTKWLLPLDTEMRTNPHCVYSKEIVKPEQANDKLAGDEKESPPQVKSPPIHSNPQTYHKAATLFTIIYLTSQAFLPYSHFVTKGYNNWTNGLYGYSWDMMIHSWSNQHMRVTYVNKDTKEVGYLNPKAFCDSNRWASHSDMAKQHAHCIAERLKKFGVKNAEIYFDVWKSMNDRFQQRMFDPRVDILTAEWHPFKQTKWIQPLLIELSDWRSKLKEIETNLTADSKNNNNADVVFVADFPGLHLENFIQEDLTDTNLTVLNGQVIVELVDDKKNFTLGPDETIQVPSGKFHNVHTISDTPSCYMYIFSNQSDTELYQRVDELTNILNQQNITLESFANGSEVPDIPSNSTINSTLLENNETLDYYRTVVQEQLQSEKESNITSWQKTQRFFLKKYDAFSRSFTMTAMALESLVTGRPFKEMLDKKMKDEAERASQDPSQDTSYVDDGYDDEIN